jgi:hypothetical protein
VVVMKNEFLIDIESSLKSQNARVVELTDKAFLSPAYFKALERYTNTLDVYNKYKSEVQ